MVQEVTMISGSSSKDENDSMLPRLCSQKARSSGVCNRVKSWASLLPKPQLRDTLDASRCSDPEEAIRIFLDAAEMHDYHRGLRPLVTFLQFYLEGEELTRLILALHQSPKHSAGYFMKDSQAFARDARVLKLLMEKDEQLATVASHLEKLHVSPILYAVSWFISLAADFLPLEELLNYWEGYFQYGIEWLLAFGLEFCREFREELLAETSFNGVMTILSLRETTTGCFPRALEAGKVPLKERLAAVILACVESLAEDSFDTKHGALEALRHQQAELVAEEAERKKKIMEQLAADDDEIVFSDEEEN
eukprot:TRINITY_DN28020_c0_g1_i1.p1 TRINITY_DN28020_c0_g1~~TRINITY_DN28020_c0_g1_i1.p1  ORF type:complete len:307 (+),score=85.92 TRINITY_DN28020_c0_g1_i1:81-1001(+)